MEEAFENMKHPMELMLLNRACIPYVAEGRPATVSLPTTTPKKRRTIGKSGITVQTIVGSTEEPEDFELDPMEEAFDNMQHHRPMELMLLSRACIPYVAN
jgi:hypothetical protein